jgi:hypothetical protein
VLNEAMASKVWVAWGDRSPEKGLLIFRHHQKRVGLTRGADSKAHFWPSL